MLDSKGKATATTPTDWLEFYVDETNNNILEATKTAPVPTPVPKAAKQAEDEDTEEEEEPVKKVKKAKKDKKKKKKVVESEEEESDE